MHHRVIALDVGNARIGVAISDPLGFSAQPLETIELKEHDPVLRVASLVEEHNTSEVVIGIPKQLDGSIGEQAESVLKFKDALQAHLETRECSRLIKIILWDERFSTQEAERYVVGTKKRNKDRSALLDRVSASIILEGYLNSR